MRLLSNSLFEKCSNTKFFLVRIFLVGLNTERSNSVRMWENTDQKKLRIWTQFSHAVRVLLCSSVYHRGNPSVREFRYQDTTLTFTRLIPENVCVQDVRLNLPYKIIELSEIFCVKINLEKGHLSHSFDITRADVRKILS